MIDKAKLREHELEKFSSVGVTEEAYRVLKIEKKKQGKSMMRLVDNLIKEKYRETKPLSVPEHDKGKGEEISES